MNAPMNRQGVQFSDDEGQDEGSGESGPTMLVVSGVDGLDSNNTHRKQWTQYEDETVRRLVHLHGTRSWTLVAQHLPGRSGKQCRERWHNHLDHDIRKDAWSLEEDRMLLELHEKVRASNPKHSEFMLRPHPRVDFDELISAAMAIFTSLALPRAHPCECCGLSLAISGRTSLSTYLAGQIMQ